MGCCCSSSTSCCVTSAVVPIVSIRIQPIQEETLGAVTESTPSQVSTYKLNIHHRAAVVNNGYTKVEKSITGHFFISLERNGERRYFGKYPKGGGPIKAIFGREKIESDKEEEFVLCLQKFEIRNNQKYLDTKTINLTEVQYSNAVEYAESKSEGKIAQNRYVLGLSDCADFVQSVYNAAGLPLYFSSVYRTKELISSLAGGKVLTAYGCLDKFVSRFEKIHTSNNSKLAAKLNIGEECIIPISDKAFFIDIDDALQKIMNQQDILASKINRIFIYNLRMENMFNLVKVKIKEQYDIRLFKVGELLANKIAQYKCDANVKFKAKVREKKKLFKKKLDKDLQRANAKLAKYQVKVEETTTRKKDKSMKKKIKKLKALIKKKNDQYHVLEEYFEGKLKSQVKGKMFENARREFKNVYTQMNQYKTHMAKYIERLIDKGDENKIVLPSYRLKLEQMSRVLLGITSKKVEQRITHDFESFFNATLSETLTSDGKKEHRISLKYFFTSKGIKILVRRFDNFKK
ncbi:uncharacterized protein LOC129580517 [Sitodiplosis mosellana]|uniref:uncharacterized protein LOC129580517 n=1 Tax=Sitodiplosis mosellana TaxID=263140 RepID=UPI00244494D2|nr:uncharacterized protein LOC129580517 [Sitodiplosis mosellana]